jgi:ABC-type lipoprotein export system ATPase subunit/ABC-type antimicrobial peptide transport system permease subunit
MESKPIIQLKNVTKDFQVKIQEIKVLRGITLDILQGEFVVILGPSGSGKSTILNLILGLEPPTTGEVIFKGIPIHNQTTDFIAEIRKREVGMVHQQANWIRSLNVIENVGFPLTLRNMPKHKIMNKAREKLDIFGMGGWANFMPSELSSGQQQKVGLSRALVTDPEIIVADEPTGNLDFKSGRKLVELLSGLTKDGKTVIMVTHDLEYIEFADRIIRILDGKVFEEINNKNGKHDIDKLKQKIVTQNVEAEKFYESAEDSAPTVYKTKSKLQKIKQNIKNFNLKRFIKKEIQSYKIILELVFVAVTLLFVIISIAYRFIDKLLGIKYWPNFVRTFQYKFSDSYYRFINQIVRLRGESVNFADMIDLSIKNLLAKKTRTYVTIGGVAMGIAFTVFLVSIGFGLEKLVLQNFSRLDQLRSIDAYSSVSQNVQINDKTVSDLKNITGVEQVLPIIAIAGKVNLQGSETDIVAYGVEREYLRRSDLNLLYGEFFPDLQIAQTSDVKGEEDVAEELTTEDEINQVKKVRIPQSSQQQTVVNTAFLDLYEIDYENAIGNEFDVSLIATQELTEGEEVDIESYPTTYKITSVVSNFDIPVIYVPLKDIQVLGVDNYSQARILTASQDEVSEVRQKIDVMGYRTESILDTITQIEATFKNIRFVLTSVGMVALAVASFGMFNTLTVSLLERIREVGLLKVMGMKSVEIKDLFLTESILLGLGGGVLGIVIGVVSGTVVSTIISSIAISRGYESIQVASMPFASLMAILLVATVTGMLTGLYPSRRATSISALNALRYE